MKTDEQVYEQLKKNIVGLSYSMQDAPYHGFSRDKINGVNFAVDKILNGTGITIESLIKEMNEKDWFKG